MTIFDYPLVDRLPITVLATHYLSLSFQYYHLDNTLVPDDVFDRMCVRLANEYDDIRDDIREYVDLGDVQSGTCLKGVHDYPRRIQLTYDYYRDNMLNGEIVRWLQEEYPLPVQRRRRIPRQTAPDHTEEAIAPTARRRARPTVPAPTVRRRRITGKT